MFTLFLVICISAIGLGLPDSLFGSAWPAIYPQFNIPVSNANIVTVLISSGTVIASFFSAKLINKFGTGLITAISTLMSTVCLLGFSLVNSFWWFLPLAFPLGAGAGAIDAALNNFTAVHYSSRHMSFFHCFYGVGVAVSPLAMSFALSQNNDWRLGYRIIFIAMAIVAIIAFVSLPLWKKVQKKDSEEQSFSPKTLSLLQMAKMPAVRTAWVVFFSSVALEFTCGVWGCTFLVSSEGMTEATAAKFLTLYYVGMTLGRFCSGLVSKKIYPEKIVYIGYAIVGIAIVTIALPIPAVYKGVALFFIGFGNGPTFPNLTYLTPINFGKDISQSIIGTQMAFCNLGILLMPPVYGFLAQSVGAGSFSYYIIILYFVMLLSTIIYSYLTKKLRRQRFNG